MNKSLTIVLYFLLGMVVSPLLSLLQLLVVPKLLLLLLLMFLSIVLFLEKGLD